MADDVPFSELLARARAGDQAAQARLFGLVVDETGDAADLLNVIRRRMPHGDAARDFVESRDVVQSALREGWADFDAFRGSALADLVAWLRGILAHRLGRVTRRDHPRVTDGDLEERATSPGGRPDRDDEAGPPEAAIREETLRRVRAATTRLPDELRLVVERRFAGLDAPAIAEELGISPAAVRKREERARDALRGLLAADGD
jgi:RNA polymerase sigma factor (sigma-70 family)